MSVLLLLPSCGGTFGTLAWRNWEDHGSRITEIRSVGVELRNVESYRGVAIGTRHTLYGVRHSGATPEAPDSAPWRYGWCPAPEGIPLLLSQRAIGLEAGIEPSFAGIALGVNHRSAAVIRTDGSQVIFSTVNHDHPEKARLQILTP